MDSIQEYESDIDQNESAIESNEHIIEPNECEIQSNEPVIEPHEQVIEPREQVIEPRGQPIWFLNDRILCRYGDSAFYYEAKIINISIVDDKVVYLLHYQVCIFNNLILFVCRAGVQNITRSSLRRKQTPISKCTLTKRPRKQRYVCK